MIVKQVVNDCLTKLYNFCDTLGLVKKFLKGFHNRNIMTHFEAKILKIELNTVHFRVMKFFYENYWRLTLNVKITVLTSFDKTVSALFYQIFSMWLVFQLTEQCKLQKSNKTKFDFPNKLEIFCTDYTQILRELFWDQNTIRKKLSHPTFHITHVVDFKSTHLKCIRTHHFIVQLHLVCPKSSTKTTRKPIPIPLVPSCWLLCSIESNSSSIAQLPNGSFPFRWPYL